MYNPVKNHFAFLHNKNIYDITGKIGDESELKTSWYFWSVYKILDPAESERIIEQCMYKIYEVQKDEL